MNQRLKNLVCGITAMVLALTLGSCGKNLTNIDQKADTAAANAETAQILVGTTWSQKGASGDFSIHRKSVSGFDGCNSFGLSADEYFIFANDGTIIQNASFMSTEIDCEPRRQELSSYPWDDWKTYKLDNGTLVITTDKGAIHRFTHLDVVP